MRGSRSSTARGGGGDRSPADAVPRSDAPVGIRACIRQLADLYEERGERLKVGGLVIVVLFGSTLEVLGIGVFLPFLRVLGEPLAVLENARFGPLLRAAGIETREAIVLASCGALVGLFALKNLYLALQWRFLYGFVYGKMAQVSREIFAGYLRSPYTFHLRRNSAELIQTIVQEVKFAFGQVLQPLVLVAAELIVALGVIGVLFALNAAAALGGLVGVGLLGWSVERMSRRHLEHLGGIRSDEQEKKYRLLQESLGGIKEIRILRRELQFLERFQRSENRYVDALRDSQLLGQYPRLSIELIAVLLLAGLVALLLLSGRELTEALPMLAVFGVAVIRLVPAASKITSSVNRIRFYAPSLAIVHAEWTETKTGSREFAALDSGAPIRFEHVIEFEAVSYRYPDAPVPALRNLSLKIQRGQSVGFVGPSGSGKTTLLHLLLGLLHPTSGRITVDGVNLRTNVGSWQRHIGFIPQDLYLLDDTIRRNIAFGLPDDEIDDETVWRALEAAQLASAVRDLDSGLDALTGERGIKLSGGQAQRLAIARALYHEPDVLILDEATSALDYETETRIADTLRDLTGSRTLIIVSHRHHTVRHSDVIHVLEGGRLASSGTFEQVVQSTG